MEYLNWHANTSHTTRKKSIGCMLFEIGAYVHYITLPRDGEREEGMLNEKSVF